MYRLEIAYTYTRKEIKNMATNYVLSGEESVKQILKKGNNKLYGIDKSVITQLQNDITTLKNKYATDHLVWAKSHNNFVSDYAGQMFQVNIKSYSNFDIRINNNITKMYAPALAYSRSDIFANVQVQEELSTIQGKIDSFNIPKDTRVLIEFCNGQVVNVSIPFCNMTWSYTATDGQSYKYNFDGNLTYKYYSYWSSGIPSTQTITNRPYFVKFIPCGYKFQYTGKTQASQFDLAPIASVDYLIIYFYVEINYQNVRFTQTPNNLYEVHLDFSNTVTGAPTAYIEYNKYMWV